MSASVTDRTSDPGWTLADLIAVDTLQAVQDAFASAFGLPTVIVDLEGRNVTEITHRVTFCEDLTRPSEAGERCLACDLDAMRRAESTARPAIFHCWNRLYDCAIPIVSSDGEVFGHFLCGQVTFAPRQPEEYRVTARELGIDEDAYVAAAGHVRVVERAVFERSVEAMGVLARMIADQAQAARQNLRILHEALAARAGMERLAAELDAIGETTAAVGATGDSVATIERIVDSLGRVVPNDSCVVFELEPGGGTLRPVAVRDPYGEAIAAWRPRVGSGIVGTVAATGAALHIDDAAADARFEPIPGVPLEPEAILAVPMLTDGEVRGVITASRFHGETFSEHELGLLRIVASQSAVALERAAARTGSRRRGEFERVQDMLLRRAAAGAPLGQVLADALETAVALVGCEGAALRLGHGHPADGTRVGVSAARVERAVREHRDELDGARAGGRPVDLPLPAGRLLVCPLEVAEVPAGELLLWRGDPLGEAELRLVERLAAQIGLALESARAGAERRRLHSASRLLAQLLGDFAAASAEEKVLGMLAERGHEVVSGTAALVVVARGRSTVLEIWTRESSRRPHRVETAGNPHLRLPDGDWALAESWAAGAARSVGVDGSQVVAVPLAAGGRTLGALVVLGERRFDDDDRGLLSLLGHAAAGALALARAELEAEREPGRRAEALGLLVELAHGLAPVQDEEAAAAAAVASVRALAGLAGAALGAPGDPAVVASDGLTAREARRVLRGVPAGAREPTVVEGVLAVPLALDDAVVAVVAGPAPDSPLDGDLLVALGRFAAAALVNSRTAAVERRRRGEVESMHRRVLAQADELERSLAIHRALSLAVLDRDGLARVAETLASFQGGRVAAYDAGFRPLAGAPDPPGASEPLADLLDGRPTEAVELPLAEGHTLLAAPIQAEGELLGWIVQRLARACGEVDRAAVDHAALAAAVVLLRERTAEEVEARLRGELLDSLFAGEASDEDLTRRARSVGYDLTAAGRVALAALVEGGDVAGDRLYRAAAGWAQGSAEPVLLARRGSELAAVGSAAGDWPHRLQEALATLGEVVIGVGTRADGPAAYRESFLAARQAVRALRAVERAGMLAVDEPGLEQLLLRAADPDLLLAFADRYLGPLRAYDERGGALLATLERVVVEGWNLHAAARSAHMHVSTLRYRLARIETLAGLDLRSADDRLAVELALRAARVLGRA